MTRLGETPRRHLLLVEPDLGIGGALHTVVNAHCAVQWLLAGGDARRALSQSASWDSMIVAATLGGERGLDIIAHARSLGQAAPALVLVDALREPDIDRGYDLNARFVLKPFERSGIQQLADRVKHFVVFAANAAARLEATSEAWRARYGLCGSELDVLLRAVRGQSRALIAFERGCSEATVKKHVSNLLRKTGDESFAAAGLRLLREASGPVAHVAPTSRDATTPKGVSTRGTIPKECAPA